MASNKNNDILTTVPSMKDLHSIVIPRVAARWNTIAHYMDFEIHEIDIIKKKCRDDPEECCAELFERWIQQRNSWKMLLTILKQIRQLAAVTERIEKDVSQLHFTADLPMLTTESQEVYQQVLKKEKNDPPSFHTSQFNNVRTAFVYLTSNVSRLLQKEDFCIIRRSCLEQINTPGGVQLSSDMVQKIKAANNLNALLDTLAESPYWSWIDLRLLEAMVTASSSSVAKDLLTSYQNGVFSKKLLEVLPNVPNKEVREEYYSKVVSKIKKDLEQITVSDLLEFQSELETVIMDLKGGTCALTRIEEGCIEVHWLVPTHCIDHAYKSACLNRHKFHTLDLQYLQIAAYGKIFDPSTLHPLKTTTVDLPPPTSAVPQVQPTAGALFTSANTSSSASMHQGTNPTVTSSTKGEIERKIPKENLMFVLDDLIRQTKDLLKEFDNNILDKQRDKSVINGVRLLLMVVNSSEFYAAMNYFSINKARRLDSDGDIYYVGEWGEKKIPAALIRQSKSGFSGPDGAQQLTITSIGLFKNLEVIIALGVCGTMGRLGDVIVSSQIDGCDDGKIQGDDIQIINRAIKCKPGRKIYKTLLDTSETWSFPCTKQGTEHKAKAVLKPMLSGVPLVASAKFREKLISGVNLEAGGLEMEGIGVINGIAIANMKDKIEFVIVKAGCDYADEEKNKEWQPVAAMAAADFVYHQLSKHNWLLESSGDVHTENKQDDASDKSIDQTTSDTVRSKEDRRADMIKSEDLKYTESELKNSTLDVVKMFTKKEYTLYMDNSEKERGSVQLLLMTVNDNEFYAALYYMANKHKSDSEDANTPKALADKNGIYFYIGDFAKIPTALVKHQPGSSESVAIEALGMFVNLKAIVAIGACGTFGELGDVIVSSKIVDCHCNVHNGSSNKQLLNLITATSDWQFHCTKTTRCLSQIHHKPFLGEAYEKFKDETREDDVYKKAMGIEMEGLGVINAKREFDHVPFIIVKAGCNYANEKPNKNWEPVAAMAAADFVYSRFAAPHPQNFFEGKDKTSRRPHDDSS